VIPQTNISDAALAHGLALRGGTALHKLVLAPPSRYSEDLDLVQAFVGAGEDARRALVSVMN
jgi:predicted nucleotidyltransferase component of viral defense system